MNSLMVVREGDNEITYDGRILTIMSMESENVIIMFPSVWRHVRDAVDRMIQQAEKGVGDAPKPLQDQSVTIAKRGTEVVIICDNSDDAIAVFDWLTSLDVDGKTIDPPRESA